MQVFLGLSLKWLVRIFLVAFYVAMGYYTAQAQNPLGWLAADHPWLTIILIAVTCFAFLPPFVTMRKKTGGGEVTMRKATWLFVFIIVGLVVAVVYYAYKPFQVAVNSSVLAPVSAGFGGVFTSIYASPIWKTYFAPTRWAFMWGLASMTVAAVVAFRFVKPQVQKIRMPAIQKPPAAGYQTTPTIQPAVIPPPQSAVAPQTVTPTNPMPSQTPVTEEIES